ncbi:hypothetical protein OESDEN_01612 [Oesophagostomum dentatum]|uniref:Peptidase A2 domain-containing protein n=1 Tax=Oesophagostomum dentatum TaxID=61180 RepID=A0A0B1TMA2_OESDE|nr:hypothetical protein OESDEN_01612 [Oesophagostomum dentatum]
MKLDEDAYRKCADDVLPLQPHEVDFETTIKNLQKLFASKKTLIRRRYECLRTICPPLTSSYMPFRDHASTIKRMDEDARIKELDYTGLETLQSIAPRSPSQMLHRLHTHTDEMPLTIEDLVAECENITALKMDSTGMEESQYIHAVQKRKVKCYNCRGPHYRSTCPLLSSKTGKEMRQKSQRKRSHRRERNQCKKVVSFAAENARTYLDVTIRGPSLHLLLDTGADVKLISRRTWKRLGSPALEPCALPVKTADGSPMKIDGRFSTDFSVKDPTTGSTIQGNGLCYVTESANLLGLEWCIQLPAYQQLKEKYHCRLVAEG